MLVSKEVEAGDRPSAGNFNALRDEANRQFGGEGTGATSPEGDMVGHESVEVLELYEVTQDSALDTEWQQYKGMGRPVTLGLAPTRFTLDASETKEEPLWLPTDEQLADVGQGSISLEVGQRVWTVLWRGRRCAITGAGAQAQALQWGKVSQTYDNWAQYDNGTPDPVTVDACDIDGTLLGGPSFTVAVPKRLNKDPALFVGYIIGYVFDEDGNRVCETDCYDDPMNTVKWEGVDIANIRDGWQLCNGDANPVDATKSAPDLSGRFIMCIDQNGSNFPWNENDIGDTGGSREHTHDDHPDHRHNYGALVDAVIQAGGATPPDATGDTAGGPGHEHTFSIGWGECWDDVPSGGTENLTDETDDILTHSTEDHRPRYYVMAAIIRNH